MAAGTRYICVRTVQLASSRFGDVQTEGRQSAVRKMGGERKEETVLWNAFSPRLLTVHNGAKEALKHGQAELELPLISGASGAFPERRSSPYTSATKAHKNVPTGAPTRRRCCLFLRTRSVTRHECRAGGGWVPFDLDVVLMPPGV